MGLDIDLVMNCKGSRGFNHRFLSTNDLLSADHREIVIVLYLPLSAAQYLNS